MAAMRNEVVDEGLILQIFREAEYNQYARAACNRLSQSIVNVTNILCRSNIIETLPLVSSIVQFYKDGGLENQEAANTLCEQIAIEHIYDNQLQEALREYQSLLRTTTAAVENLRELSRLQKSCQAIMRLIEAKEKLLRYFEYPDQELLEKSEANYYSAVEATHGINLQLGKAIAQNYCQLRRMG